VPLPQGTSAHSSLILSLELLSQMKIFASIFISLYNSERMYCTIKIGEPQQCDIATDPLYELDWGRSGEKPVG
jgi:hypothetical protein